MPEKMKVMWTYLYVVIVTLSFSSFSTAEFETDVSDEKKCNPYLSQYHVTTSNGPKTICAYVSPEKQTWNEAKFHCSLLFTELTQQIRFESSLHNDLLNRGIDILWVGIHRRNDFFVTEYPSKLFREADSFSPGYWGFHWSKGEPGPDDCVALDISSGSLQTRNCNDRLFFVCDDDGKDASSSYENFGCPERWSFSFALSSSDRTCISPQEPRSHGDAEEICAQQGGQLATSDDYYDLSLATFFPETFLDKFWVKKISPEGCQAVFIDKDFKIDDIPHFLRTVESCEDKIPFICVKHYKAASIRVSLTPKSIKPMPSDSRNAVDLLTCDLESEFSKPNMETDLKIEWYKDGLPLFSKSNVIRLSSFEDALKRDPYISDIASRQGYYHCEVQHPGSDETYFSPKIKYFYTDIATYIVEIRGIKPTNELDYSHERFLDYMNDFDEASMSNILEKMKTQYPDAEWDFMSKSIVDSETVMKIVVYIYKSDLTDFNERIACELLKEAFDDLYSIPVYMEDMSVKINCEEFPIANAYIQVIKSLKTIENKINIMENRQEDILKKLKNCEKSRSIESSIESTKNIPDLDLEQLLLMIEDLKDIGYNLQNSYTTPNYKASRLLTAIGYVKHRGYSLLHKTPDFENTDGEHDHRERKERKDKFSFLPGRKFFGKSLKLNRAKGIASPFKPRASVKERNENYIQYSGPDMEEIVSNRNALLKDL